MPETPKQGDHVSWDTPQGKTEGTVHKPDALQKKTAKK